MKVSLGSGAGPMAVLPAVSSCGHMPVWWLGGWDAWDQDYDAQRSRSGMLHASLSPALSALAAAGNPPWTPLAAVRLSRQAQSKNPRADTPADLCCKS